MENSVNFRAAKKKQHDTKKLTPNINSVCDARDESTTNTRQNKRRNVLFHAFGFSA